MMRTVAAAARLHHRAGEGLRDAVETLDGVRGVASIYLRAGDVVRHELVSRIVGAYDAAEAMKNKDG